MKPEIENMNWWHGGISLHAYCRRARTFDWNWHYHPEIELTLITKGSGTRLVGDASCAYKRGDLVLLGPNLPHTWFSARPGRTDHSNEAIVIQFQKDTYPQALLELPEFSGLRELFLAAHRGLKFPETTARNLWNAVSSLPDTPGLDSWIELTRIFRVLVDSPVEPLASATYQNQRVLKLESRLGRILNYIETACSEPLSLDDVAAFAGMTPSSFARFFRKMTGRTFVDYRNGCRIHRARRLLDETDRSIVEIGYASGFQSLPSFNRDFRRRTGQTPREFRKLRAPPR